MGSEGKAKVRQLVQVCDTSMISDASYHEIAIYSSRKHHLTACRDELDTTFQVLRSPGLMPGFKSELCRHINTLRSNGSEVQDTLRIKVSGDGTRLSRVSNFVVMSYSLLVVPTLSHIDQHVLAVVKRDENYTNLEKTLAPLFNEINDLNTTGRIEISDQTFDVELFIGCDMKFIQLLRGLGSSISNYACL